MQLADQLFDRDLEVINFGTTPNAWSAECHEEDTQIRLVCSPRSYFSLGPKRIGEFSELGRVPNARNFQPHDGVTPTVARRMPL
jgi:hypothetical protein